MRYRGRNYNRKNTGDLYDFSTWEHCNEHSTGKIPIEEEEEN